MATSELSIRMRVLYSIQIYESYRKWLCMYVLCSCKIARISVSNRSNVNDLIRDVVHICVSNTPLTKWIWTDLVDDRFRRQCVGEAPSVYYLFRGPTHGRPGNRNGYTSSAKREELVPTLGYCKPSTRGCKPLYGNFTYNGASPYHNRHLCDIILSGSNTTWWIRGLLYNSQYVLVHTERKDECKMCLFTVKDPR